MAVRNEAVRPRLHLHRPDDRDLHRPRASGDRAATPTALAIRSRNSMDFLWIQRIIRCYYENHSINICMNVSVQMKICILTINEEENRNNEIYYT